MDNLKNIFSTFLSMVQLFIWCAIAAAFFHPRPTPTALLQLAFVFWLLALCIIFGGKRKQDEP